MALALLLRRRRRTVGLDILPREAIPQVLQRLGVRLVLERVGGSLFRWASRTAAAGTALRAGMLRYGKRLKWRDLLGCGRGRSVTA